MSTENIKPPVQKDPNGLTKNDLAHLRQVFKRKGYTPDSTIAEIMYQEGIEKVIDYIETKMVAPRERVQNWI